jgi:hypothetical protein
MKTLPRVARCYHMSGDKQTDLTASHIGRSKEAVEPARDALKQCDTVMGINDDGAGYAYRCLIGLCLRH